jgi:hypothetical protein
VLEATNLLLKDALTRLSEVHEKAWRAMRVVFKASWPREESVPKDMSVLAERLKGSRCRIQAWKISAC